MTLLWRVFQERMAQSPKRAAVVTSQAQMTFEEVGATAARIADALAESGVRKGDLIALVLPNCPAAVPALLALSRLAARVALISPEFKAREFEQITNSVSLHGILCYAPQRADLQSRLSAIPNRSILLPGFEDLLNLILLAPQQTSEGVTPPGNAALIKFTSGSTGRPKGIALSTANLLAEGQNVVSMLSLTSEDRILAPVPLSHSYGFDLGVLGMIFSGATLILQESFVPRRALSDLSAGTASIFLGTPSIYRAMIETRLPFLARLSPVRYLLSCTAPLNPDLIAAFFDRFQAPICQHYGASEVGAVSTHVPEEVCRRPDSVGLPIKNVRVRIVNTKGDSAPAGQEGHVIVEGAAVAQGYVAGRPNGENPFREGGFHTGDVGVLDDDGFLYLRGRVDDEINVGGLKVWPSEVAEVLESHPAVREAAVFGMPAAAGEQMVAAIVTLKTPATEDELLFFCRRRLANYKTPHTVEIREEMPRGATGKIQLRAERAEHEPA